MIMIMIRISRPWLVAYDIAVGKRKRKRNRSSEKVKNQDQDESKGVNNDHIDRLRLLGIEMQIRHQCVFRSSTTILGEYELLGYLSIYLPSCKS